MRSPVRLTVRGALAITVAIAAVAGLSTGAQADRHKPLPTKQQVAAAKAAVTRKAGDVASIRAALVVARNKLEQAAEKAEVASEAYNGAQWRLGEAKKRTAAAVTAAAQAAAQVATERAALVQLATASYQDGGNLTSLTAFFGKGGPEQVADEVGVAQSASSSLQSHLQQYKALDALAKSTKAQAEAAEQKQAALVRDAARLRDIAAAAARNAQSEASSIAERRRQLIIELAGAQKISVRLAQRRQDGLERIAAARAAAAAAAKARADAAKAAKDHQKSDGPSGGGSSGGGNPPPVATTASAARAIAFARAQLGEQYLWAAAGPDRWDCSGLTMMAWRSGGVSLPHYSAAQYAETEHIGVGDLRPGDLVFWGDSPGTIHHVAMYIGNGEIIHAPRTGRPVEIDSMYYWVPPNYFGRP